MFIDTMGNLFRKRNRIYVEHISGVVAVFRWSLPLWNAPASAGGGEGRGGGKQKPGGLDGIGMRVPGRFGSAVICEQMCTYRESCAA